MFHRQSAPPVIAVVEAGVNGGASPACLSSPVLFLKDDSPLEELIVMSAVRYPRSAAPSSVTEQTAFISPSHLIGLDIPHTDPHKHGFHHFIWPRHSHFAWQRRCFVTHQPACISYCWFLINCGDRLTLLLSGDTHKRQSLTDCYHRVYSCDVRSVQCTLQ